MSCETCGHEDVHGAMFRPDETTPLGGDGPMVTTCGSCPEGVCDAPEFYREYRERHGRLPGPPLWYKRGEQE